MAKTAVSQDLIKIKLPPSIKDATGFISNCFILHWQLKWSSLDQSHYYMSIEGVVSRDIKFQCNGRKKKVLISRLRLGKILLNHYIFQMGLRTNGRCQTCLLEDESPAHFLVDRPAQTIMRNKILRELKSKSVRLKSMLSHPASI